MTQTSRLSTIPGIEDYPVQPHAIVFAAAGERVTMGSRSADGKERCASAFRPLRIDLMESGDARNGGIEATRQMRQRQTFRAHPYLQSAPIPLPRSSKTRWPGCAEVFAKPIDIESLLAGSKPPLGV